MERDWVKQHEGEVFTDNTKEHPCKQCRDCKLWGNNPKDYFSNKHDKSCCDIYPYPKNKPIYVVDNTGKCPFRVGGRNGRV